MHGTASNTRKIFINYDTTSTGIAPNTIIAKFPLPSSQSTVKDVDLIRDLRAGKIEVQFYDMNIDSPILPKTYYTKVNEAQDYLILMEDCAPQQPTEKKGDQKVVMQVVGMDKAKVAVSEIAKFHAMYYHRASVSRLKHVRDSRAGNFDQFMHNRGLSWVPEEYCKNYSFLMMSYGNTVSNALGGYNLHTLELIGEKFQEAWSNVSSFIENTDLNNFGLQDLDIPDKLNYLNKSEISARQRYINALKFNTELAPQTLTHCDFRSDNMFFVDNDKSIKVFDWANLSLNNGLYDVADFAHTSLSVEDVTTKDDLLLRWYADGLRSAGIDWIDVDEILQCYRESIWHFLPISMMFFRIAKSTPPGGMMMGCSRDVMLGKFLTMVSCLIHNIAKLEGSR